MTTALATIAPNKPVSWREMPEDQKALIKQVHNSSNLTDDQFELLVAVANAQGFNLLMRQVYGLVLDGKFTVFAGIGGLTKIAAESGLAGVDAPVFEYLDPEKRIPSSCSVTVYRWGPGGQRAPYTATCYFREFVRETFDRKENKWRRTKMWNDMPHNQLAKCTRASALRMAFPDRLSNVYDRAEFPDADERSAREVNRHVGKPRTMEELLADNPIDTEVVEDRDPRDKDAP